MTYTRQYYANLKPSNLQIMCVQNKVDPCLFRVRKRPGYPTLQP